MHVLEHNSGVADVSQSRTVCRSTRRPKVVPGPTQTHQLPRPRAHSTILDSATGAQGYGTKHHVAMPRLQPALYFLRVDPVFCTPVQSRGYVHSQSSFRQAASQRTNPRSSGPPLCHAARHGAWPARGTVRYPSAQRTRPAQSMPP